MAESSSAFSFPPVGTPEFWSVYMELYDRGVATTAPYRALVEEVRVGALGNSAQSLRVFEAGCGTGNMLVPLVCDRRVQSVTAFDRYAAAIATTREKLVRAGRKALEEQSRRWGIEETLFEWDADEDWVSARAVPSLDVFLCINVLYALRDPGSFLKRAARQVTRGGRIVLSNPHLPDPSRIAEAHETWRTTEATPAELTADDKLAEVRARVLAANALIAQAATNRVMHFLSPDELVDLLGRSGFGRVVYRNDQAYAGTNVTLVAVRD